MNPMPAAPGVATAMLTDLYELTMAAGYLKAEMHDREAVFQLVFRANPFDGGYTIACGLEDAVAYLRDLHFAEADLAWLATLNGVDGRPLFEPDFLRHLGELRWSCDVDAIPEGTVVFPNEPLVRVQGPLLQAQIVETALLNVLNFQSLVATKAARICLAAHGDPVIEFGLRRAQGINGALTASRAAYIGGCTGTSNVLAGQRYGIPVRGTHAHSWVMAFATEEEAFRAYAEALPNNAIFLVDTYQTLEGVRHAIEAGRRLRAHGHDLGGIRLDSGDLTWLSVEARRMLDQAGFSQAVIVASNDLDEVTITSLKQQGARVDWWGVGTRLVTAYDQPALGGVYKLTALRDPDGGWQHKIKLSEQLAKISTPGIHQVRRFHGPDGCVGDMIYNVDGDADPGRAIVDPADPTRHKDFAADATVEDLLVPVLRKGKLVYELPAIAQIRERTKLRLGEFHESHKRFLNPHEYPVGLAPALHEQRLRLIMAARGQATQPGET